MSDATALRATLNATDMTAPAIQSSSRSMMRFYDKPSGATTAVSEWRSVLQTSSPSQSMPLLYVANEVLQTSKRNRGSRYLEAFSPVLGSALQFICGRDRSVVEKVRRTVKIWGDRRVFSMRYVMEVLSGLDAYREGGGGGEEASPLAHQAPVSASSPTRETSPTASPRRSSVTATSDDDDDDDDDYDDDNDDMFGGDGTKMLDISIDATALSSAAQRTKHTNNETTLTSPEFGAGAAKRRRSSATAPTTTDNGNGAVITITRKPKALSGQNFLDLFQSIANLDERYKSSIGVVESLPPSFFLNNTDIDDLVGDELTDMYKRVCTAQQKVRRERRAMYAVAVQRRDLEREARRYVGWLRNLAKVDDDDLEFVDRLERKLELIGVCHEEAKSLRDKGRATEAQKRADAEAMAQRAMEEEERRRILDDAKMEAEAKPGMIWNRESREYEYLHDPTEESWRD